MAAMTGPTESSPTPGSTVAAPQSDGEPPRRRLDRAPGERLSGAQPPAGPTGGTATAGRGRAVGLGFLGAGIGIVIYLVLAIGFSFTAGLVVVAIFMGRFIGLFVRAGSEGTMSSAARTLAAIGIFLGALLAAVVVTWLWSHVEGGDLSLGEFLDQVYGAPLVALEFMLGTLVAWWSAR